MIVDGRYLETTIDRSDFHVTCGNYADTIDIEPSRDRSTNVGPSCILSVIFLKYAVHDTDDFHVVQIHGRQAKSSEREYAEENREYDKADCCRTGLAPQLVSMNVVLYSYHAVN